MQKDIGIIMNGATGRICSTQHLANSLVPIMKSGGLQFQNTELVPRVVLLGRDDQKLRRIAEAQGFSDWSTDIDHVLSDDSLHIFFDAAVTSERPASLKKAIESGKHIFTEKPVASSVNEGLDILRLANESGLKHGAVEDKIYAPGPQKLLKLINEGFFGRIVNFTLEFGWWVFDGIERPSSRSSWNYKQLTGGGMFFDMFPHWRYLIEYTLGPIKSLVTAGQTAQKKRQDEAGKKFKVDVEDCCKAILEMESGASGVIISSWANRVRGDDILRFKIDGIKGTAVAGIRSCFVQSSNNTPDITGFNFQGKTEENVQSNLYAANWKEVESKEPYFNPYRLCWEDYLAHVVAEKEIISDYRSGIKDVQLAEACIESWQKKKWVSLSSFD